MNRSDFSVGQVVYLMVLPFSNECRRIKDINNPSEYIRTAKVRAVGRKFLTVDLDKGYRDDVQFSFDNDLKQVYRYGCADYSLHLTFQECFDLFTKRKLIQELNPIIQKNLHSMSLEGLLKLKDLLREEHII